MFFKRLFKKRQPPTSRSKADDELWFERIEPLSIHRKRVLYCLSANNRKLSCYFDPPPGTPVADAMRGYLEHLFTEADKAGYTGYILLIPAAGLITFGRLDMAEFVISHLPPEPIRTDHGAGKCLVLPYAIVSVFLPVPHDLRRPGSLNDVDWVAGTPEGKAVQHWFAFNKNRLVWDTRAERFILS